MTLCACGCGEQIIQKVYHCNRPVKYLRGHHMRVKHHRKGKKKSIETIEKFKQTRRLNIKVAPLWLCECGCNEITFGGKRFICGHDRRNIPQSNAAKRKLSIANTGQHIHSEKQKKIWSKQRKGTRCGKNNPRYGKIAANGAGRGKRSYYISPLQGQVCFRSSYELAYAKYLDSIHELWMYEMETFDLGNTTYTPDFFLPRRELFIEIKGYMSEKSQQKINKFNEQYTFNLEIIGLKELKLLGVK